MSYKYINSRQVLNNQALDNVGSSANDNLADILNLINNALSSVTGGKGYVAQRVNATLGSTSYVATVPSQPDTSYIVLAMFENEADVNPQFQQISVTAKSTTGFTFTWNAPLESGNYYINFVIPPIVVTRAETAVGSGVSDIVNTLFIPQNGSSYGIVASMQDLVDTNLQFQTPVITSQTAIDFTESFNALTGSSNYQLVYMANPTGQIAVPSSSSSITIDLPVAYGSAGYAVVASMSNLIDLNPEFQPLLVTNKGSSSFTVSFNAPVATSSYLLTYYAISLTS